LSHHRWLIEIADQHIQFTPKYHMIHGDLELPLPTRLGQQLSPAHRIAQLDWSGQFTFAETTLHGLPVIRKSSLTTRANTINPSYGLAFALAQRKGSSH
jgi:hypothetical protein